MNSESGDAVAVSRPAVEPAGAPHQTLSGLPIAVCLTDSVGHLIHANSRAEVLFGLSRGGAAEAGRPLHDVLGHLMADGRACAGEDCAVMRALQTPSQLRLEREQFAAAGDSAVMFDWISAPWNLPGSPASTVILLRDVTSRSRREDSLAEQQRVVARAHRLAQLGVWEYDIAADRVIWSPSLYGIFGIAEGTTVDFATYLSYLHPDDRRLVTTCVGAAIEDKKGFSVHHRIVRADGVTRVVLGMGETVSDEEGRTVRLVGTAQDVTDRVEAERRALELAREKFSRERAEADRERLTRMFEQAPAMIAVTSGATHVVEFTNARCRELVGREMRGLTIRESLGLGDDEHGGVAEQMDAVYASAMPLERHHVVVHPPGAGEARHLEASYQPLVGADGRVEGLLCVAVDVTERRRAEAARDRALASLAAERRRLEVINAELDQFAYVASHDLKAPLRGVANLAQWIEEDLQDSLADTTRDMLGLLRSRMHRMEALIDGLLEFSRAGRVRQKPERIEIGALLAETIELLSPTPDIAFFVAPDMPVMVAERLALQQVFLNLISNAVKHTQRHDATIEIDVRDRGDQYEFHVRDNGPGIAPEFHDKIWGIFQTLQPRDRVEGTGIGLALVKKIVETRGGSIWVRSAEGEGATFAFTWPKHTPVGEE